MKRLLSLFLLLLILFSLLAACSGSTPTSILGPNNQSGQDTSDSSATVTRTPLVVQLPTATAQGRVITEKDTFVYEQNQRLGKGIVLLPYSMQEETQEDQSEQEQPSRGDERDEQHTPVFNLEFLNDGNFEIIKEAGFNSVILPVAWSYYANQDAPYEMDLIFLDSISTVIDRLIARNLNVVLYFDDYPELNDEPRLHQERFLAIWDQVADYLNGKPDQLLFGIYMNPQGTFASTSWNDTAIDAINIIRETNPERTLLLGADFFNPNFLPGFQLPEDDRNIIVTFSFFQPFQFTVQGMNDYLEQFVGTTWNGTDEELALIHSTMDSVAKYSQNNARPVALTAFGCTQEAEKASRARWLHAVARAAEDRNMSWFYYAFADFPFSIFAFELNAWDQNALQALIPE